MLRGKSVKRNRGSLPPSLVITFSYGLLSNKSFWRGLKLRSLDPVSSEGWSYSKFRDWPLAFEPLPLILLLRCRSNYLVLSLLELDSHVCLKPTKKQSCKFRNEEAAQGRTNFFLRHRCYFPEKTKSAAPLYRSKRAPTHQSGTMRVLDRRMRAIYLRRDIIQTDETKSLVFVTLLLERIRGSILMQRHPSPFRRIEVGAAGGGGGRGEGGLVKWCMGSRRCNCPYTVGASISNSLVVGSGAGKASEGSEINKER